jgi:hypothetical protein
MLTAGTPGSCGRGAWTGVRLGAERSPSGQLRLDAPLRVLYG